MRGRLPALIVCVLALTAGTARASSPLRYIGFVDNLGVNSNTTVAQQTAQLARAAGGNTMRVVMTWQYPYQHEIKNDSDRICSAASAAANNGMVLFLDIVTKAPSGQYGALPDRPGKLQMFGKTITDYLWALIGPNGCAQNLPELDIEIGNEPNYSKFCRSNCPYLYTQMLSYAYDTVHREILNPVFKVPVNVIGGELSSSNQPEQFILDMGVAAKQLGLVAKFYDMFSYHCYGVNRSLSPTPPDGIRQALQTAFGWTPPLLCTEYAVQTSVDAAARQLTEVRQSSMAEQAMRMGSCYGLRGVLWFHLFDDPPGPKNWHSGLYYYDASLGKDGDQPVAKSSLAGFTQAAAAAAQGSFSCA